MQSMFTDFWKMTMGMPHKHRYGLDNGVGGALIKKNTGRAEKNGKLSDFIYLQKKTLSWKLHKLNKGVHNPHLPLTLPN